MRYQMWMNNKEDWERDGEDRPLLVSEEHAEHAVRSHNWTQVRFVPTNKADAFEKMRRAEIEREELAVLEYNQGRINTYYGGYNLND